jgi:hypothetical protein
MLNEIWPGQSLIRFVRSYHHGEKTEEMHTRIESKWKIKGRKKRE